MYIYIYIYIYTHYSPNCDFNTLSFIYLNIETLFFGLFHLDLTKFYPDFPIRSNPNETTLQIVISNFQYPLIHLFKP